jgi:Arc/MetJ-type ribon-helix-helix transcriptional regulator
MPGAWLFLIWAMAMADETKDPQTVSMRPSHLTLKRIERLKVKLGTKNSSEVIRRAIAHFERSYDAEAVWIQEAGEKQRVFLD